MSFIAKTAATYQEPVKPVQRAELEQTAKTNNAGAMNIKITETPATTKMTESEKESSENQDMKRRDGQVGEQKVKNAASEVGNKLRMKRTGCEFTYHEETKRVSIKVFDKDTKQVIREIPPEESLKMIEKAWELAGIIVDEKR